MGSLDDQKLRDYHDAIQYAICMSSKPDWQKACEVLNGMSMDDMLDELWRIKGTGRLDGLAQFAPRASGVNNSRLRVAMGVLQDGCPADFETSLRLLPRDQQLTIKSARVYTQAPVSLAPTLWPKYYWSVRSLPPLTLDMLADSGDASSKKKGDDDTPHAGLDILSGLTANAPRGANPATYTITLVYRNVNLIPRKFGNQDNELTFLHEPNISLQISPDPNNSAAYQAAISLVNLHVKRNWGLIQPDIEFSLGAQAGVTAPGNTPGGGVQAQVELHVTTTISVVASSALNFGPPVKPGDPPDRGAVHFGNRDADVAFTPFMIGIVGHWDPP